MDCWYFVYLWESYFVDVLVFSFSKKTLLKFVFVEDANSWGRAIPRNCANMNSNDSTVM